jgi:hypothetical protein
MATKTKAKAATNGKHEPVEKPDVLNMEEAAALLRVPVAALRIEVAKGIVPGRVIDGEWRFSKAAILAWLSTPQQQQTVSGRDRLLALAGIWKDHPIIDDMMQEVERQRKADRAAGG